MIWYDMISNQITVKRAHFRFPMAKHTLVCLSIPAFTALLSSITDTLKYN